MFCRVPFPNNTTQTQLLRDAIEEAWVHCIWECLQLALLRLVDPEYSPKFVRNCLHDPVEINNVVRQLDDSSFRDRHVYRGWYYIRPLLVKYLPDSASDKYKALDDGLKR